MLKFIHHLFIPHQRNNHRAKILHNFTLFLLIIFFSFFSISSVVLKENKPEILGVSYSLSNSELLVLVNKERADRNLKPLILNQKLSMAAEAKANDMFAKNYWSHFGPDGSSPWDFIKRADYSYQYAGENLAKGFSDPQEVVSAWMNSPTHRDNILSDKYSDIGFAISKGKLQGEDTILVVQMFGATQNPVYNAVKKEPENVAQSVPKSTPLGSQNSFIQGEVISSKPAVDINIASRGIVLFVSLLLLAALTIDLIIVEKKKIPRFVGHNIDHIMLIFLFVVLIIIERNGSIF